ncbi:MAG: HPr kinase/phosphorylase [Acetobacteraceae bacterium]
MQPRQRVHGSCAARDGAAVLVIGPPGSGKSDLVLRLLAHGFQLVADDQVEIEDGVASAPPALAGLLETRGLGITRLPHAERGRIALVAQLDGLADRLPQPETHPVLGVPVIHLDPTAASAPDRVALALRCALGQADQVAGAFAA